LRPAYAERMKGSNVIAFLGVNAFFIVLNGAFVGCLYGLFKLSEFLGFDSEGMAQLMGLVSLALCIWFMIWSLGFIEKRLRGRARARA
jgi:hypothetical protein